MKHKWESMFDNTEESETSDVVEGWSEKHGLLCVACNKPIQDNDKVIPVYKAHASHGTLSRFFGTEGRVSTSGRAFPLFAHLRCNE